MMKQVTLRVRGQDELTERQKDRKMRGQESVCGDEAGDCGNEKSRLADRITGR